MATVYIGLGSNIGDRENFINRAIKLLSDEVDIIRASSIYESEPVGFSQQPPFLNAVVKAETVLSPRELLEFTQSIEEKLGRKRGRAWGPRTIDLDLLLYDEVILQEADLIIPHPRLHQRAFVLTPLCEIDSTIIHPVLKKTVSCLLKEHCQEQSVWPIGELRCHVEKEKSNGYRKSDRGK